MNLKSLILNDSKSIYDAVKKINSSKIKTIFVINEKNKFVGTISDGDIRRALIKKLNLKTKLKKILTKKNIILLENSNNKKVFEVMRKKEIQIAPILNNKKEIIDYKILNEKKFTEII